MKTTVLTLAAVIGLGVSSAGAATLCLPDTPPAGHPDGLAITDVKLEGASATNCYGTVIGNTSNTDLNAIAALKFGDTEDWGPEIKDNSPGGVGSGNGSFFGVDWTLSSSAGKIGTWSLSFVDTVPTKLNFSADILVLLKASNKYAAYYFNDFLFDSTTSNGDWDINFVNNGNQTPNLSHISVYFRDGNACDDCGTEQLLVPEPASLALLGTAFLGVGLARRRRRQ